MCGIAGSIRWRGERGGPLQVARMISAMVHRGPDAGAVTEAGCGVLGHRRLAVIDTAPAANQPMRHDGSGMWLVFNGEIYNFRDLRAELKALGHTFRTSGDTEVLLSAYVQWGQDCFARFNGMFACALWDPTRNRLVLARDRLGKKPLYIRADADGVDFASELTALTAGGSVVGALSHRALGQYLSCGYTLTESSILDGVEKLPAAHLRVFEPGAAPHQVCYWDLAACFRSKRRFASEAAAVEELGTLVDDATRLRLAADVPLGAFLSGGLDSAVIVESMLRQVPAGSVRTFTIGFGEAGFSEIPEARHTAEGLGVSHADRRMDLDLPASLGEMVRFSDEPFADTSLVPFHHLSRFARESVTVALSGDGGDELFAGYVTYTADKLHRLARYLPGTLVGLARLGADHLLPTTFGKVGFDYKVRQFLAGAKLDFPAAHCFWRTLFTPEDKLALLRPGLEVAAADPFPAVVRYFDDVAGCHWLDQASYVDIKTWLVDDILVKVDRATMAHSLEARAPLLDHRVVEFAAALPPEWKLKGFAKKHLLRRLARTRLPAEVVTRPKAGFNAPVARWLAGPLQDLGRATTTTGPLADLLNPKAVAKLWDDHLAMRRDNGYRLFALVCLGLWLEQRRRIG